MDVTAPTVEQFEQPTLQDGVAEGHRRAFEGMALAKANAHPPAYRDALQTIHYLASLRDPETGNPKPFTADDLHDRGHALGNAMGSVFGEAKKLGIIEPVPVPGLDEQVRVKSRRPELHRCTLGLWRGVA